MISVMYRKAEELEETDEDGVDERRPLSLPSVGITQPSHASQGPAL